MLKDVAKQHGPTAGIALAAVIATALVAGGHSETVVALQNPAEPHPSSLSPAHLAHNGQETRLVSCGDSRKAQIVGNDTSGEVVAGPGAHGSCTVVFAAPWTHAPSCTVTGATLSKALATEIVVRGEHLKYRCAP